MIPQKQLKALTNFHSKTLIISENQVKEELKNIPYRYNNGHLNLPIEPMIEIANNWSQAEHILINDPKIEEVIIIGKNKYQEHINSLINFKNGNYSLKKIILIGSEKANSNALFATWHWTLEEINELKSIRQFDYQKKAIKDTVLKTCFTEIKEIEDNLITKYKLIESQVRQVISPLFTSFYRCFFFLTEEKAVSIIEKIKANLEDKEGNYEIICDNAGMKKEEKELIRHKIITVLLKVIEHLKINNQKLMTCQNPKQETTHRFICEADDCENVNAFFKKNGIRRTKAISVKDF